MVHIFIVFAFHIWVYICRLVRKFTRCRLIMIRQSARKNNDCDGEDHADDDDKGDDGDWVRDGFYGVSIKFRLQLRCNIMAHFVPLCTLRAQKNATILAALHQRQEESPGFLYKILMIKETKVLGEWQLLLTITTPTGSHFEEKKALEVIIDIKLGLQSKIVFPLHTFGSGRAACLQRAHAAFGFTLIYLYIF